MQPSLPRFGAHLSVAGGLDNAFRAGAAIGADCLQIFVKNQRQWSAPPLTDDQIATFHQARRSTGLAPVVAHASYLLNLASPEPGKRRRSQTALLDELKRCEALGVPFLVLHPGAAMGEPEQAAIVRVARALDTIHTKTAGYRTMILLETTAGQGSTIGHRFEHLGAILCHLREPERAGVCMDTCHLFAAGYDFRTRAGYEAVMDNLENAITVAHVKCIHVNDSKGAAGSRIDRHEHIGKGKIGKTGFAHFVNDPRWANLPMILETPKGKDGRGSDLDKVNIKRLRALVR